MKKRRGCDDFNKRESENETLEREQERMEEILEKWK